MCKMGIQESTNEHQRFSHTKQLKHSSGEKKMDGLTLNIVSTENITEQRNVRNSIHLSNKEGYDLQTSNTRFITSCAGIENSTADVDEKLDAVREAKNERKTVTLDEARHVESGSDNGVKKSVLDRPLVYGNKSRPHANEGYRRATVDQATSILTPADSDFRRIRQIFPWLVPIF